MPFGADHHQPAGVEDCFSVFGNFGTNPFRGLGISLGIRRLFNFLVEAHVDVAAQLDVGAAAGHIGGDGNGTRSTSLGDDLGFLFVITRVKHVMGHLFLLQHL